MDDKNIKKALSYSLGSDLHDIWRSNRKKEDGTYEPRIKKSKDEDWNISHGTDEVDIANCSFDQLPSNWQYENLEAAKVVIDLVYDKIIVGELIGPDEIDKMASIVHQEWLKRNTWVCDPNYGDPKLTVPYKKLSKEEQDKDKVQVEYACQKVQAYVDGLIDIESLCNIYSIKQSGKSK